MASSFPATECSEEPAETDWRQFDTDFDQVGDYLEFLQGSDPVALSDSDNDSVFDLAEYQNGTDPLDGTQNAARLLHEWSFETPEGEQSQNASGTMASLQGLVPTGSNAPQYVDSFDGKAAWFPTSVSVPLRYAVGSGATANLTLRHGTIRLSYVGDWNTSGASVPGDWCRLLECGAWALSVAPTGRHLVFTTPRSSGVKTNLVVAVPDPGAGVAGKRCWVIQLCYARGGAWIWVNGTLLEPTSDLAVGFSEGGGVEALPDSAALNYGMTIGSGVNSAQTLATYPARGFIDRLQCFNALLVTAADVPSGPNYQTTFGRFHDPTLRRRQVFTATATASGIKLRWVRGWEGDWLTTSGLYALERRTIGQPWPTSPLLTGIRASTYTDTTAVAGTHYEYRIAIPGSDALRPVAAAARLGAPKHHMGRVLLLVANDVANDLGPASTAGTPLQLYVQALEADGWSVETPQTDLPVQDDTWAISNASYIANLGLVKTRIRNFHNAATQENNVAILLGHVTVPYAGNAREDGHADHLGAWPADIYYGDVGATDDSLWPDDTVNQTSGTLVQPLRNVQGDGKPSRSDFPATPLEVAIGRIDFRNLPAFNGASYLTYPVGVTQDAAATERALLKHYLAKDIRFRKKLTAVTGDVRTYVHALAFRDLYDSWLSIATKFSGNPATALPLNEDVFVPAATYGTSGYLWGVHGGWGGPDNIARSQNARFSAELALIANEPHIAFFLLSGSYFGDWNAQPNEFMRACLALKDWFLATFSGWDYQPQRGP